MKTYRASKLLRHAVGVAGLLWIALLRPARTEACGPYFPNQLLIQPDEAALAAPVADLARELVRLGGPPEKGLVPGTVSAATPEQETEDAEIADATAMLEAQGVSAAVVIDQLRELRKVIRDPSATPSMPPGLPDELRLYLEGALAFHRQDLAKARASWEALLALPDSERRFRSVWAAYMIGRSWLSQDAPMARLWFQKTRALAAAGLHDSTGLAIASFGEEARTYLERDQLLEALTLYTKQAAHGSSSGVGSVQAVVSRALDQPKELRRLAGDQLAQGVVTAYFLARSESSLGKSGTQKNAALERWLGEVERAQAKKVAGADRLAWLSYRYGRFDLAARWLERGKKKSIIHKWVQAKLSLRNGKLQTAAKLLAEVSKGFPKDELWDVNEVVYTHAPDGGDYYPAAVARAELALIELSRGDFVQATDALLRAGYWLDGAYLAERVLTLKELEKLIDDRWPAPPAVAANRTAMETTAIMLRELLARRFMRAGRHLEAAAYFTSNEAIEIAKEVDALTAVAADEARPRDERAAALWTSAQRWRHGMETFGTELGPDWTSWGGSFELGDPEEVRKKGRWKLGPTREELRRAARTRPSPNLRWHYRHKGADLAWRAAALMPDDDPHTIEVLCLAGSWLKARAPKEAERFFKAMVKRGPNTALGALANGLNWFPERCSSAKE